MFNAGSAVNSFSGWDENLHVVERIKRTDRDTLLYEFTVDDPTAFNKPETQKIASTEEI